VQLQSGQVTEALRAYEKGLEISQKLAAADPTDAQAQRDLSLSYLKLGHVQLQSGQVTEALRSFEKSLEIRQKLAATDPTNAQAQTDLHVSYDRMAQVEQAAGHYESAILFHEKSIRVLKELEASNRLPREHRSCLDRHQAEIAKCKHAVTALGDWKTLMEQPAESLPVLLELRGMQMVQEGRANEAIRAVAKLRELGTATADQLHNAACVYSLCAAAIKPEKGQDALTAEQSAARQQHIADALATLREAIAAGWKDLAHMQQDPDLAPLRDLPEFKALLLQ
jgi:tetratricopeptide (TPR) repeat protein